MGIRSLIARFGLVPRRELEKAQSKKEVWHSLVRDVFARYYLKLREPFPDLLPNLPRRYSSDWEKQMKQGVEHIATVDFQGVDELLKTCGFGTAHWQDFTREILPRLGQIIAEQSERESDQQHSTTAVAQLQNELREMREESDRLRLGGRKILEQLRKRENQLAALPGHPAERDADDSFSPTHFPGAENGAQSSLEELERENRELRGQLATREQTIAALNNQLDDLENDMSLLPAPAAGDEDDLRDELGDDDEAEELLRKNEDLQKNLRAKEHTVSALRGRVEAMEEEMDTARDKLLAEVKKLGELTSGQLEIKPALELEHMDADALLDYAQEVATDLDVRRQTFDEGLKGLDTLKDNYGESRALHEAQQKDLEQQLEKMMVDLQNYEEQAQRQEEKTPSQDGEQDEVNSVVLTAQREQLRLLSGRIKELQDSNRTLNESNQKMYRDLDLAVKRIVPLRKQIEELESLRDALTNFVRQKYDRNFTIRKLS